MRTRYCVSLYKFLSLCHLVTVTVTVIVIVVVVCVSLFFVMLPVLMTKGLCGICM